MFDFFNEEVNFEPFRGWSGHPLARTVSGVRDRLGEVSTSGDPNWILEHFARLKSTLATERFVYSKSSAGHLLRALGENGGVGAADYFQGAGKSPINPKEWWLGFISALAHTNPNVLGVAGATIESFRDEHAAALRLAKREVEIVSSDRAAFEAWSETNRRTEGERIEKATKTAADLLADKGKELSDLVKAGTTDIATLLKKSSEQMVAYQQTFKELTRLREPAAQWKLLSEDYDTQWRRLAVVLVLLLGALLWSVAYVLYHPPAEWLQKEGLPPLGLIRITLTVAIGLSLMGLVISLVSRAAISALHLARDAKERYQLTHVYLALIAESGEVKDKEREIVYSALFSRSDTGLLKSEGTPAMPNSVGSLVDAFKGK